MTHDQYWHGDPNLVYAYIEADRIRRERADEEAWLHGLYVAKAINATICNAFRDGRTRAAEYPELPLIAERKKRESMTEEDEARLYDAWADRVCQGREE